MAQLVARLVRNEKVGGSNPPSSTTCGRADCPAFCVSPILFGYRNPGHLREATGISFFQSSVEATRPWGSAKDYLGLVPR